MKKLISCFVGILLTIGILATPAFAAVPKDGDVDNIWGQGGIEIDNATASGIPVKFIKADGASWAVRISSTESVKMDGFKIVFKNFKMPKNNAGFVFGFNNESGAWVDSKGLYFLNFHMKTSETLGALDYGYVMGKVGNDMSDKQPRFVADSKLNAYLDGTVTIQFKKASSSTWTYTINGQKFEFSNDVVKNMITDTGAAYFSLGVWSSETDISYTIADITDPGKTSAVSSSAAVSSKPSVTSSKPSATSSAASSTASVESAASSEAESTVSDETSSAVSSEASANTSSVQSSEPVSGEKDGGNILLPIILIVVLLAACGTGAFFIIKNKKSAGK